MISNMSLFDVEDVDIVPKVRDMTVGHVADAEVVEFCRRYHYTGTKGPPSWHYGLWHGPTLWGVVAYNLPTPDVCRAVFGPENGADHVWHMGRLVLPDHAPRNSESRLIGGSIRLIERWHPSVWAVLTYAAPSAGHIGYVYQATNALYTGTGGHAHYYLDTAGQRRSENQIKVNGSSYFSPARATAAGWTRHSEPPKHRYVYILGGRRERRQRLAQLKLPTLPYPKVVNGA